MIRINRGRRRDNVARVHRPAILFVVLLSVAGCGKPQPAPAVADGRAANGLARGSNSSNEYVMRAAQAMEGGQFRLSLALLDSATVAGENPSDIRFQRGRVYFELSRFDDAVVEYGAVAEIDPTYPGVWLNLGNVAMHRNQFREALRLFAREAQVAPAARPMHAVGGAYWELGRPDSAEAAFKRAVVLDVDYAPAEYSLAELYQANGDYEEAFQHAQRAVALQPDEVKHRLVLGQIQIYRGNMNEAVVELSRVVEAQPWNHVALFSLGQAQQRLGLSVAAQTMRESERMRDLHAGVNLAESYAVENPNSFTRQVGYADALRKLGRLADALRAYQRAALLRPDDLNVLNNVATLYVQLGQPREALARYAQVLRADSTHAEAWLNVAVIYMRAGQTAAARRALAAAQRHSDTNAEVRAAVERIWPLLAREPAD